MAKLSTEISLTLPNRRGELAALAKTLSKAGVNIAAIASSVSGPSGTIRLLFADQDTTAARRALKAAGYRVNKSAIRKVVTASGADKPGTLARLAGRLSDAGLNIDSVYIAGQTRKRVTLAFGVGKNAAKAKRALS